MTTTLVSNNSALFPATRYMVWGSDHPIQPVLALPNKRYINAARVSIPTGIGKTTVDIPDTPPKNFLLHQGVAKALVNGWVPTFNGEPFVPDEFLWHTPHHTCLEWTCRLPNIVVKLWTYLGNGDSMMYFEGRVYCESLETAEATIQEFGMGSTTLEAVLRPGYLLQGLPAKPTSLHDSQGLPFDGQFLFFQDIQGVEEVQSMMAAHESMPSVLEVPRTWGPLNAEAPRGQPIRGNSIVAYLVHQQEQDPGFFWPGVGNTKQGGSTGHQPGFGAWDHLDTILAKEHGALYCFLDHIRAGQEACRPGHYFEPGTGSIVDPIARAPDYVTWDGVIHWHPGVGRDRLGRTHGIFQTSTWTGQDRQHMNMKFLSEQVLLYGSMASQHELKHRASIMLANLTIPRLHGKTSPNGALVGRAGRSWQALADIYNATGDKRLLDRVKEHFIEDEFPYWKKMTFGKEFSITRVIANDGHTFGQGKEGWFVWEDAIYVQGLVALAQALRSGGFADFAFSLETQAGKMAKSIIFHGHTPDGRQIAKAILFLGDKNKGIHTGTPLTAAEWEDRNFAIPADGADYKYWATPCLDFARSFFAQDKVVQGRLDQIEKHREGRSTLMQQGYRRNFLGFGG